MEKRSRLLEYLVTSLILIGIGLLFFFMNTAVNTYTVLHFALFQIMQSVLILICAILLYYRMYIARKEQNEAAALDEAAVTEEPLVEESEDAAQVRAKKHQDAVDSINATMLLIVITVLVVGYYIFTMKPNAEIVGSVAPLHMVVCVVAFILYACVERWWSMQLKSNPDAASICNLMVLNKISVIALMADMTTSFTGLFSVSQYVDYVILACWIYVAVMAVISVVVKVARHRREMEFYLYVIFPVYYYGGQKGSGALAWLEKHTGISMRSLWSLKFIKMILPSCGLAVVVLIWLSTCIVQIEPYQQGALYRFGSLSREDILEPGLHFKLPIPFEEIKIYNVTQPQGTIVGYEGDVNNQNNLWTRPHEGEEQALLLGNGNELVAINLKIVYRISDLYDYLTRYSNPEDILNAKGYEIIMGETINTDINTVISEDRGELSHRIEDQLKSYVQEAGLGLEVMSVTLASIHPPVAIADVYQSVVSADIQKKTSILTAEGEALVARESAEAERQVAINDAGIQRDERVSTANAEVEEYNASIEAFQLDPEAYMLDKYLETFEKALGQQKKYIIGPDVNLGALYANFGLGNLNGQWFNGIDSGTADSETETSAEDSQASSGAGSSASSATGEGT